MITSRKSLLCTGLLAASLMASGAFAQAPVAAPAAQAQSGAQPAAKKEQRMQAKRAQRFEQMKQRHAKRLSALKDKLQITPAQEGAWNSFVEARQLPSAPPEGARMKRDEFAKLTTPQRLDLMEKRRAEINAMAAKRTESTRALYAALTPEQQKTFDAQSARGFDARGHGDRGDRQHRQHRQHRGESAKN
jgi:hypothetical protein